MNVVGLKGLYPFTFKIWTPKCIKVWNKDKMYQSLKQGQKPFLALVKYDFLLVAEFVLAGHYIPFSGIWL